MRCDSYRIFSEGKIGNLALPNRLVRSVAWDPSILGIRKMTDEVLNLYVGMIHGTASNVGDVRKQPSLMEGAYKLGQKLAGAHSP